jgi:hypothetical protein
MGDAAADSKAGLWAENSVAARGSDRSCADLLLTATILASFEFVLAARPGGDDSLDRMDRHDSSLNAAFMMTAAT